MTPNFSLSLSVDGIVLLHRVSGGWHHAGEVSLDAPDLTAEMARLRDIARGLAPDGLYTKLILPNEQIRYLTIETARTSLEDIHSAIVASTPVALDEMVIDFDRSGGRTFIAAVAKQTLLEAETFAQDHGFEPVSFVAIAESYTFSQEVFFGPTSYARDVLKIGAEVVRDDIPAVATGIVATQDVPPATATPIVETPVIETPVVETPAALEADLVNLFADEKTPNEPETIDIPMFTSRNAARAKETATPAENTAASATPTSNVMGGLATAEPDAPAIPRPVVAEPGTLDAPRRILSSRRPKTRVLSSTLTEPDDSSGLLAQLRSDPRPTAVPVPKTQADLALAKGLAASAPANKPRYLGVIMTAALLVVILLVAMWAGTRLENGIAGLFRTDPGLQEDAALEPVAAPLAPVTAPEVETASDIVATPVIDTPAEDPPTPIVTAIPGRVLSPADAARIYAATGVWQRAPRMPERSETENGTLEGIHTFDTLAAVQDIAKPGEPDLSGSSPDRRIISPSNPAPANRPLPRDENGFVRAAASGTLLPTGILIYGRAPSSTPPRRPTDEPVGLDDTSIPTVQEDILTSIQNVAYTSDATWPPGRAYPSTALSQPLELPQPDPDAPQGLAAAQALVTLPPIAPPAPGPDLFVTAPQVAPQPVEDTAQSTPASSADAVPDQQVPTRTATASPDAPLAPFAPRDDGFVAPDTFVEVITGRPAVVPPLRPGTPEIAPEAVIADAPETAETPEETPEVAVAADNTPAPVFQDPALAGLRPNLRPENLVVTGAQTFEALPALAGPRPLLRPASLATSAPDAPSEDAAEAANPADISAIMASIAAAAPPSQIINPTRSAIVASPRPGPRPQNFARVVASAQALQSRQQSRDTASATAAAAVPAAPAPAPAQTAPATGGQTAVTVARAATVDNAIRLRDMNLIGVYGKAGARRALIRLSNGRFVKVEIGSSLDGGRVTAIGDSALNFVKRGQTYALQLPAG